jgi:hypothetical protein
MKCCGLCNGIDDICGPDNYIKDTSSTDELTCHVCNHTYAMICGRDDCPLRGHRKQQRVVCAAIRAADGELLLGIRHYSPDMQRQIQQRVDGNKFMHRLDEDQGFVDQFGNWLNRHQAWIVADEADQIKDRTYIGKSLDGPKLYSEALY